MLTASVATSVSIRHYYKTTDCIPDAVPFIPMPYSFLNWKPVLPSPHSPTSLPSFTYSYFLFSSQTFMGEKKQNKKKNNLFY